MEPYKFDAERKAAFVLAFERCGGEISAAAAAVKVSRVTVYTHLKNDPEFAEAVEQAEGRIDEMMMAQVKRLAIDGVEEPMFDKTGKQVGVRRKYSERVLLAWLKRRNREWRDHLHVDKTVQGRVEHEHRVTPRELPKEARNRVRDLLDTLPVDDVGQN